MPPPGYMRPSMPPHLYPPRPGQPPFSMPPMRPPPGMPMPGQPMSFQGPPGTSMPPQNGQPAYSAPGQPAGSAQGEGLQAVLASSALLVEHGRRHAACQCNCTGMLLLLPFTHAVWSCERQMSGYMPALVLMLTRTSFSSPETSCIDCANALLD